MNIWESETIVRAMGWTLVHFVWEGLAIAAVLAAALRLMRRSPAQWRYLAGCVAMLAMAVAPLATFQLVLGQGSKAEIAVVTTPIEQVTIVELPYLAERSAPPRITPGKSPSLVADDVRRLKSIRLFGHEMETPYVVCYLVDELQELNICMPWLVTAWLAGVCLLSCRLLAGWWQVRRLASNACSSAGQMWEQKLVELARRLGVNRSIRLVQSALVEVPTVIGWLRPVILLPASCLAGLTPGQLEAILAHELAHIRRHDYLVNLLQSAVETLLFYHPAVWWVSRKMREERENCCDDLAVAVSGDRVGYARALATLEELRPAPAQLALAAGGMPLLRRIRRLAGQPERGAGRAGWPVAGIVLLLGLGLLALGTRAHRAQAAEQGTVSKSLTAAMSVSTNRLDTNSPPLETRTFKLNRRIPRQGSNGVVMLGHHLFSEMGVSTATSTVTNTNGAFGGGLPFITSVPPAADQAGEQPAL
jgi:beta-lactamase regulating signal transducer with metallopeptidase domain